MQVFDRQYSVDVIGQENALQYEVVDDCDVGFGKVRNLVHPFFPVQLLADFAENAFRRFRIVVHQHQRVNDFFQVLKTGELA